MGAHRKLRNELTIAEEAHSLYTSHSIAIKKRRKKGSDLLLAQSLYMKPLSCAPGVTFLSKIGINGGSETVVFITFPGSSLGMRADRALPGHPPVTLPLLNIHDRTGINKMPDFTGILQVRLLCAINESVI